MSEAVTALNGARATGFATIAEAPLQGMITLRGDLKNKDFSAAVKYVTGAAMPKARMISAGKGAQMAWMAPDELLILCAYDEAQAMAEALNTALAEQFALAVVVSDARAMFQIEGEKADQVIAKLAPVDTAALGASEMRRTRLAQVAAAVWRSETGLNVVCFRSTAQYVFDALATVSREGSEVF